MSMEVSIDRALCINCGEKNFPLNEELFANSQLKLVFQFNLTSFLCLEGQIFPFSELGLKNA